LGGWQGKRGKLNPSEQKKIKLWFTVADEELKILLRKIHHFPEVLHTNLKITNQIKDKESAIYFGNIY
jgi:hypothetical protein